MRLLHKLVAAASLSLLALGAGASPSNPQSGVDYRVLDKAQQTDAPAGKVEVTEFFWYSCPHCNALDPSLNDWVKKHADKIVFKRVPVAFRESFVPQQRLYYTLEAMGKLDELHAKVFRTIHADRHPLDTEASIINWIGQQPGIDKQKFAETYNSFGIQSKARRATQLQAAYQVDGVPLIAIDGRYITSPSIVGTSMRNAPEPQLHAATLQVMDALVAQAAKEKGGSAAAEPAKKK
ncbi:Thiol:disulfide interchange protein DsbA [Noviherbaspirillum humi]|uniref:Thiol:disulfide interchange protein DsbA n=1 Tax=Noviherbaspirillum humi TaxID=1688639 RepID=A0A239BWM2_9BURK|nr:thiol:disulfide interchange protein DsbA/DsbL [Noviherbaspirillum humi]SNS11563.1 Thiol:disulfide interchange protein DsbA [Noviherbaspirillum humi]